MDVKAPYVDERVLKAERTSKEPSYDHVAFVVAFSTFVSVVYPRCN